MFYTYKYPQYIFDMPYSAHYIIYTALSTLYLRVLHPDCMFATKLLDDDDHFNHKRVDVPFDSDYFFIEVSGCLTVSCMTEITL